MDLFRAIFESSDVEEAEDQELTSPPSVSIVVPDDPLAKLFNVDKQARDLEKKVFTVPAAPVVILGPARPPPEILAAYASATIEKRHRKKKSRTDNSDSENDKRRTKRKKDHKPEKVCV